MSEDTQSKLDQAFELVEAGQPDEAVRLLTPVLADEPDNADAWWVYAHAVSEPREAQTALENVLRIAPDYPGARAMFDTLHAQYPEVTEIMSTPTLTIPETVLVPPVSLPEPPPSFPEVASAAQTPVRQPAVRQVTPVTQRASPIGTYLVVAVVAIAAILLFVLLTGQGDDDTTPTEQAPSTAIAGGMTETFEPLAVVTDDAATEVATLTSGIETATEETAIVVTDAATPATSTPVVEPTDEAADATSEAELTVPDLVGGALTAFTLQTDGAISIETTELGSTVLASVCASPGRELRALLPQVMEALASVSDRLPDDVLAVGTRMINCVDETLLLAVVTPVENAIAFAEGDTDSAAYAATLRALR